MEVNEGFVKISGKDVENNNFTYIRSIRINEHEYSCTGHYVKIPADQTSQEIVINFYGAKIPLSLYLPAYYKLYHGELVKLRIHKKHLS